MWHATFNHLEDIAYGLLPNKVSLHGSSRHVLYDILDNRHCSYIDVLVASHWRTSERIARFPLESLTIEYRTSFALQDVIQRVRTVAVGNDMLTRTKYLDTKENRRKYPAGFSCI